jgi:hypothetical protein
MRRITAHRREPAAFSAAPTTPTDVLATATDPIVAAAERASMQERRLNS